MMRTPWITACFTVSLLGSATACVDAAPHCFGTLSPCQTADAKCLPQNVADGTACDDGNSCTTGDTCKTGTCVGGAAVTCTVDVCNGATCDPTTGCTDPSKGPCVANLTSVPLGGCHTLYWTNVSLGNDQNFALIVDSGSSTLAVAAATCSSCTGITPKYTPGSTAMDSAHQTRAVYGDSQGTTGWSGEVYTEQVMIPGVDVSIDMSIAAITSQNQFFPDPRGCDFDGPRTPASVQGIIGFAFNAQTANYTQPFMDELAKTNINKDAFAVQMCEAGGALWVGGYNPATTQGFPQFTALSTPGLDYGVTLADIQVNGVSVGVASNLYGPAVVDTGTTELILPEGAYNTLSQMINADPNFTALFGTDFFSTGACAALDTPLTDAQLDAMLPQMSFLFPNVNGSGDFTVSMRPSHSYLINLPSKTSGTRYYCPGLGYGTPTILGIVALASNVTVFDRKGAQIGFAPPAVACN